MRVDDYLSQLPNEKKLSEVKEKILRRLWGKESDPFPKPWVSSKELLALTDQKYFDRRARELRDQLGCDLESMYIEALADHAWRINSPNLNAVQDRNYLTQSQKTRLFEAYSFVCSTCGKQVPPGVRGLQADHKVPLSRGGGNEITNWQPMCNNCNVGKRRACEGCTLDCNTCSWAFPEKCGIPIMLSIGEQTLRRVDAYISKTGESRDKVMEDAANYYLDEKEGN